MCISEEQFNEGVAEIQGEIKELKKLLIGNGAPEEGVIFKLTFLNKIVQDHLVFHKNVQTKAWEVAKPFLMELVKGGGIAGVLYLLFKDYITLGGG